MWPMYRSERHTLQLTIKPIIGLIVIGMDGWDGCGHWHGRLAMEVARGCTGIVDCALASRRER